MLCKRRHCINIAQSLDADRLQAKYCVSDNTAQSALPVTQWRLVNFNSFELPAAFADGPGDETTPFWAFFDRCSRAMDAMLAPDHFIRSNRFGNAFDVIDTWDVGFFHWCGPVITSMTCHQFGHDWKPIVWRWILNGERYDPSLPSLNLATPLRSDDISSRLYEWLAERNISPFYPPEATDDDDEEDED
jgi:hypothetical protein